LLNSFVYNSFHNTVALACRTVGCGFPRWWCGDWRWCGDVFL